MLYQNASGDLNYLAVRYTNRVPAGCNSGTGIFVQSGNGQKSDVTIENNSVHDYQVGGHHRQ